MISKFMANYSLLRAKRGAHAHDWLTAKTAYRKVLNAMPAREDVWVQYGHAEKESGNPERAEFAYRRALSLNPQNADTHFQLGALLRRVGRLSEAKDAYANAISIAPNMLHARREFMDMSRAIRLQSAAPRQAGAPTRLNNVIIGTTGLCNASCLSCPTGKAETDHNPRVPMAMDLFKKIVESIASLDLVVEGQISFGLFGDGLVDPHVLERARFARSVLPDARISVNTNGAAYNPKRHAGLSEYVTLMALHAESIDPDTYDKLMQPLRAKNVFPKISELLRDFPDQVYVSVPVSRYNVNELEQIRQYFRERGAHHVCFDPISNRCSEKAEPFRSMALDPVPIRCSSEILDDLIVDCDGRVMVCCQDFTRAEPIGNLAEESLSDVMTNMARQAMRKRFDEGRHTEMKTCANCYADMRSNPLIPQ